MEQLLPSALDAERHLLAVSIAQGNPLPDGIYPSLFFEPQHQDIAAAIVGLTEEQISIDELTVTQRLRELGSPVEAYTVSGMATDGQWIQPNKQWASEIQRTANLRKLAENAKAILRIVNEPGTDPEAIVLSQEQLAKGIKASVGPRDSLIPFDFKALVSFEKEEDDTCVLGNRFLCRGGSCEVVSQTGVGKSALLTHAAITLGLGMDFFGIRSKKGPLRSVIIQSENDAGDVAEAVQGCLDSLGIVRTSQDIDALSDRVFYYREAVKTGADFGVLLRELVVRHKADLVWLDPLLAFAGCDVSDQEQVSHFLRHIVQPVLLETGVILFSVHHTTKPAKEGAGGSLNDLAYAGAGSAELANWHRAVMVLQKDPTPDGAIEQPFYTLRIAKRGGRAGVRDAAGNFTTSIKLRHAKEAGRIAWVKRTDLPALDDAHPSPAKGSPRRFEHRNG